MNVKHLVNKLYVNEVFLNEQNQNKNPSSPLNWNYVQIGPTKTAPLLINPIEMRVLWTEIKYTKSAARLLDRVWVNKGGLDLSKEVLWVFVGQRTAELPAIKVGGLKKILPNGPARMIRVWTGPLGSIFFSPPTLIAGRSAAL